MAVFTPARKKREKRAREGRRSERERVREAERELGCVAKRWGGVLDAWSRGEGMATACPLRGPLSSS
jgi:transposase InsO family protein